MTLETLNRIKQALPAQVPFHYYADRESAWLLAHLMPEEARVPVLRKAAFGKLLDRPILSRLVAQCGGVLRHRDVLGLADADRALKLPELSAAGRSALEQVYTLPWQDFELSFDIWGAGRQYWDQTTRQQGNLVVQLGFPSDHAALMGRYLSHETRKNFEFEGHPIRLKGRPTLAWARLDVDFDTGEALIEEVQSDWLRFATEDLEALREGAPRSRQLMQMERYEAGLVAQYGRIWAKAALLAALLVLREGLFLRRIWMHQPGPGATLKRIEGAHPPRSLYSQLPKSFCFEPTRERPTFLKTLPARVTKRLPKSDPLFWRLDLI